MVNFIPVNPYYNPHAKAGEEVSSTYEGRHVRIIEWWLVHEESDPEEWPSLVNKGQPVAFFNGVGVALNSASSWRDAVVIDTEGIWRLSVVNSGRGSGGLGIILPGQILYIDFDGIITDDPTDAVAVFGYALQPIWWNGGPPVTKVIAVKVHWMESELWIGGD